MSGQGHSACGSIAGHHRAIGVSRGGRAMASTPSINRFRAHGVGVRAKRISRVEFVCPRCGLDRTGAVIEQQRWYHVVGVPIIPLATLDSAVRCDECGHRSSLAALEVLTAKALTECLRVAV